MNFRLLIPLLAGLLAANAASAEVPTVTVDAPAQAGPDKDVAVLIDHAAVKIVAITLRGGTPLPDHQAPVPVTIETIHGDAAVTVGGDTAALPAGSFVVLDANTTHSVVPVGTQPVTLLVHHHKGGAQ